MDFTKAFSSIQNLKTGTVKELKTIQLDEYDISFVEAPNELEFIRNDKFLNIGIKLFPVQFAIVRDFFELLCPNCNDIEKIKEIENYKYKNNSELQKHILEELDKQILFEYGICPHCYLKKSDIYDKLRNYNELVGVMGMRSGKSLLASCISAAYIHKLLCIKGLQSQFGLFKDQELDISFVATSERQVASTVYGQFKSLYKGSPWFCDLKKKIKTVEKKHFALNDLYMETKDAVWFKFAHLRVEAQHSNSDSLAGRTRILAVIDELARFDDVTQSKRSADEVYRVIKNSLATIDSATKRAYENEKKILPNVGMICITSPIHQDDKSMQLLKECQKNKRMFGIQKATWEANPTIKQEDLKDRFIADPIGAERDFGANPPGANQPFIEDSRLVDICIDLNRKNGISIRERRFVQELIQEGNIYNFNYITADFLDVKYNSLLSYVMHCDPGKNKDSFCLAIGHAQGERVIIDCAVELRPLTRGNSEGLPPHTVFFPGMTSLILDIHKHMRLKFITYDRWNSAEQIDKLRIAGIPTIGMNLDRDDHVKFAESIRMQRINFPAPESDADPRMNRGMPCAKALYELKMLNDNGKKVDHLPGYSNDMIQCYVGVHRILKSFDKLKTGKGMENTNIRMSRPNAVGRIVRLAKFR